MNPDWDKSGLSLQSYRVSLGPSLGLVDIPGALLTITSAMTIPIPFGVARVEVNVAVGGVVLTLPSAKGSRAGPMAQPNTFAIAPITICDIGGHAFANPIAINAQPGETIANLASVQIAIAFGTVVLKPNITSGQWSLNS